jgi:hypothetical protein
VLNTPFGEFRLAVQPLAATIRLRPESGWIMNSRIAFASIALALTPSLTLAQLGGGQALATPSAVAPQEATQFDFLVGRWELDIRPVMNSLAARIHGSPKVVGTWNAWRSMDGWGIEDEIRLTDEAGNPRAFSHAVRAYDPIAKHWNSMSLDIFRGVVSAGTAEYAQGEMIVTTRGAEKDGKPFITRTRYFDISRTTFKVGQQRSTDDGRNWTETFKMQAKRVAAVTPG